MAYPEFIQGSSGLACVPLFGDKEDSSDSSEGSESASEYTSDDEVEEEEDEGEDEHRDLEIEGENTEKEIEGDFDRLVKDIRERNDSSLSRDWDISIADQEETFKNDLRAAAGIGRRRKKAAGRAAGPVLSQQVRALIGEGNQAFVDNDIPETIRVMQEVIRIEPRAAAPWTVLAQCYEDMKQPDRALQLRIMAAHLRHDAEEWDVLAQQSKEHGHYQQALYCYRKVYSLDPSNVDALWDRAVLAKEIGDLKTAGQSFMAILKRVPHDLTVLEELRPILIEMGDLNTCTELFQAAFTHYQARFPTGEGPLSTPGAPASAENVPGGGFSLMSIFVLADLYNTLGEYEKAVHVIRGGCRWLQGRGDQKYWDRCEDDREYDLEDQPRQAANPNGNDGESSGTTVQSGYFSLDVNARHRLAIARIKMGEVEEGIRHANVILTEDPLDYSPLFVELADAYFEREMYAQARPIYEVLGSDPNTAACLRALDELKEAAEIYEQVRNADPSDNDVKMKLAEIYEMLGETRWALDLVYQVIESRKRRRGKQAGGSSATTEATPAPASNSLFFEERSGTSGAKTKVKDHSRLTPAQLRELEAEKEKEVIKGYQRLTEIWDKMIQEREAAAARRTRPDVGPDGRLNWIMLDEADEEEGPFEKEWMAETEKLVETFRETRNLFTASRNSFRGMFPKAKSNKKRPQKDQEAAEDRMASRLQLDLENETSKKGPRLEGVTEFRGVSFTDWMKVFMQYCFILTKRRQYELADEILRHILMSNAYLSTEYQVTIRLTIISCAILSKNFSIVVEQCRKLISTNQFNNEMYRLLMASLSSGLRPTDSFITSTLQKFLFREMKLSDAVINNPDSVRWNPVGKRWAPVAGSKKGEEVDEDEDEENPNTSTSNGKTPLPMKTNPLVIAIYGQMCVAAKSYQSAIFYLLHAYDYLPQDPMICLCLAIASIGRAMQRQSDNRHHLIAQGLAFLSQYRTLRKSDPKHLSEVEFNFGRAFQQLGLNSLAVKHYERVLRLTEEQQEAPNLAREAAYNLSLIYITTGAAPLAQALYRRWLSLLYNANISDPTHLVVLIEHVGIDKLLVANALGSDLDEAIVVNLPVA
ncbi:transcription factor TFIIIC subunit tfc4 [Paramarasmius palmivorus]|uniref:Transcription factor TFIIIC subunit tfc4 n=1 Tax=Paramarasmius palmivorus TaxID=297713 RepID=A0AAW0D331_9AGAR